MPPSPKGSCGRKKSLSKNTKIRRISASHEADPGIAKTKLLLLTGKPFSVSVQGIGAFPSPEEPRVVWAGVRGEEIISLLQKIQQVFSGKPSSEEPRPHITLARAKSGRNRKALQRFITAHALDDFGMMRIDRVVLYQSNLKLQGAVYNVVEEVFLAR